MEDLSAEVERLRARGIKFRNDIGRRRIPLVGNAKGIWSFIHIDDAATATALAIERGEPGIYNIVDDEPASVPEWLPVLASAIGAKPLRWIPAFLARILVGSHGVAMMTEIRGASNAKAKRTLAWQPGGMDSKWG